MRSTSRRSADRSVAPCTAVMLVLASPSCMRLASLHSSGTSAGLAACKGLSSRSSSSRQRKFASAEGSAVMRLLRALSNSSPRSCSSAGGSELSWL
eukprot:19571-Heterococcus_DN1.PRE.1